VKVVFLDIDGVLVNRRALKIAHDLQVREVADPVCVKHLNEILAKTGAKIVISSCWRIGRTVPELQALMDKWHVKGEVIDRTECDWDVTRGKEIQWWLNGAWPPRATGPEVESFVILDDDKDMGDLLPRLVQTRFEPGLTAADAKWAIQLLNDDAASL
jgi:hypothetical protein